MFPCRAPGQERFTRLKTLGVDYTEEALRERISRTRTHTVKAPKPQRSGINLLIYIQNCIKAQESKGYEQWAKIHNLETGGKGTTNGRHKEAPEHYFAASRIWAAPSTERNSVCGLWEVEKASQGICCYQAQH